MEKNVKYGSLTKTHILSVSSEVGQLHHVVTEGAEGLNKLCECLHSLQFSKAAQYLKYECWGYI